MKTVIIRSKRDGEVVYQYNDVTDMVWSNQNAISTLHIYQPGDVMRRKLVATIYNVDYFAVEVRYDE